MSLELPLYSSNGREFSVDYEFKNQLGKGSFSEVWLCVRLSDGAELAAKILKKNYGQTMDEATWNAIPEVTVAVSIDKHPYLLATEDAYHDVKSGKVILVVELMKKSLYDVINSGQCAMTDARIKCYMYQMLEGLKYLHENGFIHRDIKPENILLRPADKLLKIGDFGTACHVSDGLPYAEYVATRWYRAPECALTCGWYSTKMDIWAAGCVLYEMATYRPLFDGRDGDDQMEKIERVLGPPSCQLVNRFRKHKSDLLVARHETVGRATRSAGVGLHAVYQPFRAAYELLKEMIVYDPIKRFSADRLLRKPYFHEMAGTAYERKVRRFEAGYRDDAAGGLSSAGVTLVPTAGYNNNTNNNNNTTNTNNNSSHPPTDRMHGPGGDRVLPDETTTGRRATNRGPEHVNPLTASASAFGKPSVANPLMTTASTFGKPSVVNPLTASAFGKPSIANPLATFASTFGKPSIANPLATLGKPRNVKNNNSAWKNQRQPFK